MELQTQQLLRDLEALRVCVEVVDETGRTRVVEGILYELDDGDGFEIYPDGGEPVRIGDGFALVRFVNPPLEKPARS